MEQRKKKEITSLLLSSIVPRDACEQFVKRWSEVIEKTNYVYDIPELEVTELKDGTRKCIFNFTDYINAERRYDLAVSDFIQLYEKFILDVLSIDKEINFELSALLNVDQSLATFEVRCPKIPTAIASMQRFAFDYWIWHSASDEPSSIH